MLKDLCLAKLCSSRLSLRAAKSEAAAISGTGTMGPKGCHVGGTVRFFPFAKPSRGLNSSAWPKSMNGSRCSSAFEPRGSTVREAKRRLPLATPGTPPKTVPNFPSSVSLRDAAAPPCSPCRSRCSRIRRRLSKAVDRARTCRRGANGRLFSRLGSRFRSRPRFAGAARARYTRHDFAGTAAKTSLRIRSFAIQRRR